MWDMQKVAQALLDVYAEYKCPDIRFTVTLTPKDAPPEKGTELCPVQLTTQSAATEAMPTITEQRA